MRGKRPLEQDEVDAIFKKGEKKMHYVSRNLYLQIGEGNAASWIFKGKVRHSNKRPCKGLGSYLDVSLGEALGMVPALRKQARQGVDFVQKAKRERLKDAPMKKKRTPTFAEAARDCHARKKFKKEKDSKAWIARLENHIFPTLGSMQVDDIKLKDVVAALKPVWEESIGLSRRCEQCIRVVFRMCMLNGYIDINPAAEDKLKDYFDEKKPRSKPREAVPYSELHEIIKTVNASDASNSLKLSFEFICFTGKRLREVQEATWEEFDLERGLWTIPNRRVKTDFPEDHRIPLSDYCLSVLEGASFISDGSKWVFPSPTIPGQPLSENMLTQRLHALGVGKKHTPHGSRSCLLTWGAEKGHPLMYMKACLGQKPGNVKYDESYLRTEFLDQRRPIMQEWVSFLAS